MTGLLSSSTPACPGNGEVQSSRRSRAKNPEPARESGSVCTQVQSRGMKVDGSATSRVTVQRPDGSDSKSSEKMVCLTVFGAAHESGGGSLAKSGLKLQSVGGSLSSTASVALCNCSISEVVIRSP